MDHLFHHYHLSGYVMVVDRIRGRGRMGTSLSLSRPPRSSISNPIMLLIIVDYPPNYEHKTDECHRKTHITTDDFIDWSW